MMSQLLRTALVWKFVLAVSHAAASTDWFLVRSWQSEDGLPSNNIRSVVQAADGYLWVATAEGVVRFDGVRFISEPLGLGGQPPRALYALESGEVWIATMRGGLWRWSGGQLARAWPDAEDEQEPRVVRNVVSDGKGGAWIECRDGVYQVGESLPPKYGQMFPEPLIGAKSENAPRSVMTAPGEPLELTDRRGSRWATTPRGGLVVSESGKPEQALPEFPEGVRIVALLEDREGHLWVATNGSGLFQIRPQRVHVMDTTDGLSDLKIRALMEDRTGALYAANRDGGIDCIRDGRVESFPLSERNKLRMVSSICEDRDGVLWVAKENGGVYRRAGDGFEDVTGDKPWERRLVAMVADAKGGLWLGGSDGVVRWWNGGLKKLGTEHGIPAQPVTTLALDEKQRLWIGTARGVVYQGQDNFTKAGETGGAAISALLPDRSGAVWAATLGGGLFLLQDGGQTRFNADDGLPDARLTCVLDDEAGHLWLGSLAGIFRVSKAELLDLAAGRLERANWIHLDRADGMVSRECTGGFQPAGCRSRDGTLRFPTVHGIASIRPQDFELNQVPPQIRIEKALSGGREIVIHENGFQTGPGRSRLEFHYTALSFAAPEKVRFRTRLEGLQDDWQETGIQRVAAYEAVPPGMYVFRVMAANNDGLWSENDASLAVRVLPHFWETLWFRSAALLGVVGLAFGIGVMISRARSRMKLLRLEAQTARLLERERIAQDLHDDLGASLTEISLLAGLAAEESDTVRRHDAIPGIAGKAQSLVSTLDEIVWAVNPRHDTLASFVEYLTASAAELLDSADIALRLEIAGDLPELALDSAQRHALFLAGREALNNAVKHSGSSEVRLKIEFRSDELVIVIKDNGSGFAAEDSSLGEGLCNMQARLTGIGGSCDVTSNVTGTTVVFTLAPRKKG